MAAMPVHIEVSRYQLLREQLLTGYPQETEESLADTLEEITDLHEMIAAVIRSALVDEALTSGLRSRIDEMKRGLGGLRSAPGRSGTWRSRP